MSFDTDPSPHTRPVLMLPGIGNSGPLHWQSLWESTLPSAARVNQSEWDRPECADWCDGVEQAVQNCPTAPIVVAHSLGCLALAHWAARTKSTVAAALLVAVPDPSRPSFPEQAQGFMPLPLEPLRFPSILVTSSNDPYASVEFAVACAEAWRSRLVHAGAGGHLNAASNLGPWEFGFELLIELERAAA